jgi:high-affinity Fe2+/Pb2+ permease
LANIIYAAEFTQRYPDSNIKAVSVHPGAVYTALTTNISLTHKIMMKIIFFFLGVSMMEEKQGRLS